MTNNDWELQFSQIYSEGGEDPLIDYVHELLDKAREEGYQEELKSCPPHNLIPYHFYKNAQYPQAWGGSVPPPNMKCSKCLMEVYV